MPDPRPGEGKEEYIERCIPVVIDDGTADDAEQAYAVCNSMWEAAQEEGKTMTLAVKFSGSPRSKFGTHASYGFKGDYAAAWRCHFSQVGGGALTADAAGPLRGTVRRTEMIAAAMKPPCDLPGTDSISARGGPKSPLDCTFPEKPGDYGLSSWEKPEGEEERAKIQLTCADLAVIKRAALAEVKRRIADREKEEKSVTAGWTEDQIVPIFQDLFRIALAEGDENKQAALIEVEAWAAELGLKAGRVLSERNAQQLVNAVVAIADVLENAGVDVPGYSRSRGGRQEEEGEEEEGEEKSAASVTVTSVGDPVTPGSGTSNSTSVVVLAPAEPAPVKSVDLAALKLIDETPDFYVVGGYGHVWGHKGMTDLVGDYFTPDSDLVPDLAPVKLVFYDHTLTAGPDSKRFDFPIGRAEEKATRTDEVGKWVQAQIDKRAKWVDAVMELVNKGILAWSSGAVPHLVKRAKDGWLERWAVVEYTMTPTPCEPRMTDVSRLKAAYEAAGLKWLPAIFEPDAEGPQSEGETVTRLAVERERNRLLKTLQL